MLDSNPQNKIIQQVNQQTDQSRQQSNQKPQFSANPKTDIPNQNPPMGEIKSDNPQLKQDATKNQQEDKKGFKAFLQEAKQKVIEKGKKKLIEKGKESINNFTSKDSPDKKQPNPQVNKTVEGNPPTPERPQPNIPTSNRPSPKTPNLKVPNTQFKMPKFKRF